MESVPSRAGFIDFFFPPSLRRSWSSQSGLEGCSWASCQKNVVDRFWRIYVAASGVVVVESRGFGCNPRLSVRDST